MTQQTNPEIVTRSAFKVNLGNFFSLLVGLGSQSVVVWLFGAGTELDA